MYHYQNNIIPNYRFFPQNTSAQIENIVDLNYYPYITYYINNNINNNITTYSHISNNREINNINFRHPLPNDNKNLINNKSNKTIETVKKPCGIINYGNNCYLNSGLQILATCDKFVKELEKYKNIKFGFIGLINEALYKILNEDIYDPKSFLNHFCLINSESSSTQYCSQNFIRTLLNNINKDLNNIGDKHLITEYSQYKPQNKIEKEQYFKFIKSNNFFPESMALKLFSGLIKSHSFGLCNYCKEQIEDFSFSYFIDQNIYLDNIYNKCNFKSVLSQNLGNYNNLTMNCPKCDKEINIKEEIKIIKLPEILIFTLERYINKINNTLIEPDEIIDMKEYIDTSVNLGNTKYGLFAINIRFGKSNDFGHEICQVKRNGQWYEINDTNAYIKSRDYNDNSYGLFYKRL